MVVWFGCWTDDWEVASSNPWNQLIKQIVIFLLIKNSQSQKYVPVIYKMYTVIISIILMCELPKCFYLNVNKI